MPSGTTTTPDGLSLPALGQSTDLGDPEWGTGQNANTSKLQQHLLSEAYGHRALSLRGVLWLDTNDGLYKGYDAVNRAAAGGTSTDAAVVARAMSVAFSASGGGLIGIYQPVTFFTNLQLKAGTGLVGGGPSQAAGAPTPTITTGAGFTSGAPVISQPNAESDVTLAYINVDATTGAARALSLQGDDAWVINCSFKGGTTDTTSITGVRWTVIGMRSASSSGSNTAVFGGSDGIATHLKIGGNTGNGPIFKINASTNNGLQFSMMHLNASSSSPTMDLDGNGLTFTDTYLDGTGGTASVRVKATAGKITMTGGFIRDGQSPGGIPIFQILGGTVTVMAMFSEHYAPGGGANWGTIADVSAGAVLTMIGGVYTAIDALELAAWTGAGTCIIRALSVNGTLVDNGPGALLVMSTAFSKANDAAENDVLTVTIPANRIKVGAHYQVKLWGVYKQNNGGAAVDYIWKLYLGGNVMAAFTVSKANAVPALPLDVTFALTLLTVGASGSAMSNGNGRMGADWGGSTNLSASAVDTTAAMVMKVTVQMSAANANTNIAVFPGVIHRVGAPTGA